MSDEAWLNGKLEGFAPVAMPAAHALKQAIADLRAAATNLTVEELNARPSSAPPIAFHLRHIAGSIDRLLTYARAKELNAAQFNFLQAENEDSNSNADELLREAIAKIENALKALETVRTENLFEDRFVGRQKLPTNVFGLLFHIAEHTARHVGQIVTTAKIVRGASKQS